MQEDKITIAMFESQASQALTSATGSYRKIICKAQDIIHDIILTQNTNEDLITPDYLTESDPTPIIKDDGQ